jgi:hypothetical protein
MSRLIAFHSTMRFNIKVMWQALNLQKLVHYQHPLPSKINPLWFYCAEITDEVISNKQN